MANWDVFQRVPSRVQSPVIFLSSFDYGMLISFLALFSTVRLRLMPYVRACFVFMCIVQLLIPIQASLWAGPANSLCQLFIIIFANIFLATRLVHLLLFRLTRYPFPTFSIYSLTKSRIQGLTPIFFSTLAFVFGMITVVATTWTKECVFLFHAEQSNPVDIIQSSQSFRYGTSVVWYTSQTTAECLISCKFFLLQVM